MTPGWMTRGLLALVLTVHVPIAAHGGEPGAAFEESFDGVVPPALPPGWVSSRNKAPGADDFATASGTAHSGTNALLATNATVAQDIATPPLEFTSLVPDRLDFYLRRSSSFRALCVVEASVDSGETYALQIGDTLRAQTSTGYVFHSFSLPPELTGARSIRFRWRVIPDMTGTTGTLRMDDVSVRCRPAADLALTTIRLVSARPDEDEAASALVGMKNLGEENTFAAAVCVTFANDALPQPVVLATCALKDTVGKGDSTLLAIGLGKLPPGEGVLTAFLVDSVDQDRSNDTVRLTCAIAFRRESCVINEIMYAPEAPEPEWVEILNRRTGPVDLKNWLLSDAAVTSRHPIVRTSVLVPSGGYVLLTRDSSGLRDVHHDLAVPVLAVAGFPSLNNDGDATVLYDPGGRVIDSLMYDPLWGGADGRSLERIDAEAPATEQTNWGPCRGAGGSTPGIRNSIARRDVDISMDSLTLSHSFPRVGDTVTTKVWMHNPGRYDAVPGRVDFYCTEVSGNPAEEYLGTVPLPLPVPPLGRAGAEFRLRLWRSGDHRIRAVVVPTVDEDSTNNSASTRFRAEGRAGAVRINEILYDPDPGGPEWIELYNRGSDTLDLNEWRIGNRNSLSRYRLVTGNVPLVPGAFAVVTKDSGSFARVWATHCVVIPVPSVPVAWLGNVSDAVVVTDSWGVCVDSVPYRSAWGRAGGTSLERRDCEVSSVDSLNWAASGDSSGGTPGRENSVVTRLHDLRAGSMFAHLGPGIRSAELTLRVHNDGKMAAPGCRVKFSELVDTSVGIRFIGDGSSLATIGWRDSVDVPYLWTQSVPGVHTILGVIDTVGDGRPGNNSATCQVAVPFDAGVVVINEVMFDPGPGRAEYVELMNTSSGEIDVKGWTLEDWKTGTGIGIANGTCLIPAGGFLTVASDSSVRITFAIPDSGGKGVLRISRWGSFSLANSGDDIALRDASGRIVDSVSYRPSWHRTGIGDVTGRSLERIRPTMSGNDARNWSTCVDLRGGTPNRMNSIYAGGAAAGGSLSFAPNPFSPDGDGFEDFAVVHFEGPADVAVMNIKIFDVKGRLVRRLANSEAVGRRGERIWDGCDDERRRVRMGIYVVFLELCDEQGHRLYDARGAIVVAGRL